MTVIRIWRQSSGGTPAPEEVTSMAYAFVTSQQTIPMSADPTEGAAFGWSLAQLDLTGFTEWRLSRKLVTVGDPGRELGVQYWDGAAYQSMGAYVAIDSGGASGSNPASMDATDWTTLPVGARGDVILLLTARGGGALLSDAVVAEVAVQFR